MKTLFSIIFSVVVILTTNSFAQVQSNLLNNPVYQKIKKIGCLCVTPENCPCYAADDLTKKPIFTLDLSRSDFKLPKGTKLGKVTKTKSQTSTQLIFPNGYVITYTSKEPITTDPNAKPGSLLDTLKDKALNILGGLWDKFTSGSGCQPAPTITFNISGRVEGNVTVEVNCPAP